jgi:hypothetical protein
MTMSKEYDKITMTCEKLIREILADARDFMEKRYRSAKNPAVSAEEYVMCEKSRCYGVYRMWFSVAFDYRDENDREKCKADNSRFLHLINDFKAQQAEESHEPSSNPSMFVC